MINVSKNKLISYFETFKFFLTKKNCKVLFFKVPSSVLYSYLDYDVVGRVSNIIDLSDTCPKHALKLEWLINSIRSEGINNPVQLIKSGTKYICHPGTDKILVATYLLPVEYVTGFYIWYPELDDVPFMLDYTCYEISNPFKFIAKFKFSDSFYFKYVQMSNNLDISDRIDLTDKNSRASLSQFSKAKSSFLKTTESFNVPFLSFIDRVQWENIGNSNPVIHISRTECQLAGIPFKKINSIWIADIK